MSFITTLYVGLVRIFLIAIIFLTAISLQAQHQFRGNAQHTGLYDEPGLFSRVRLHWEFMTGSAVRSTPLIINNRIFFGSGDKYLYALDTAGNLAWKFLADAPVHSSPAFLNGVLFFTSRANTLYALHASTGKLKWRSSLGKDLPYEWAFDYYSSSPMISEGKLYVGSGSGELYSIDPSSGKTAWKFNAGNRIRSTPAADRENIYFGDCNGKVYALNKKDGSKAWQFSTNGDTMRNENFGFDRKAIIASPAIANNTIVVGGRDGYLYAIDSRTGSKRWQSDYKVSWVISSVAIMDTIVVTGTSDGRFINALNLDTGNELWRFNTSAAVWSSPSIINNKVIIGGTDGSLYSLDLYTGKEIWRERTLERFFCSPVPADGKLFIGDDEGKLYCFQGNDKAGNTKIHKGVYWIKEPPYQYHKYGLDIYIKDYFAGAGYTVLDTAGLADFLRKRIQDGSSSVLVFATNLFPSNVIGDTTTTNLLLNYLKTNGKLVFLGMNPAVYIIDEQKKVMKGGDLKLVQKILGLDLPYYDTRALNGFYPTTPTKEGNLWGLHSKGIGLNGLPPSAVSIVLSTDETNRAVSYVKQYGPKKGTGIVQTWLFPVNMNVIREIHQVAEYGLD